MQKNVHGFDGGCDPRFAGQADTEWSSRIEAQRVTLELRTKQANVPSDAWMDSPLFGGPRQYSLLDLIEMDRED
jgi:hypothetical protein